MEYNNDDCNETRPTVSRVNWVGVIVSRKKSKLVADRDYIGIYWGVEVTVLRSFLNYVQRSVMSKVASALSVIAPAVTASSSSLFRVAIRTLAQPLQRAPKSQLLHFSSSWG